MKGEQTEPRMPLRFLEERCQRFIELMREGSAAIERKDATGLESISATSEELLAQIERACYLTLSAADVLGDNAEWGRLRQLLTEAIDRSAQNQRRIRQSYSAGGSCTHVGPPQGTA